MNFNYKGAFAAIILMYVIFLLIAGSSNTTPAPPPTGNLIALEDKREIFEGPCNQILPNSYFSSQTNISMPRKGSIS